MFYFRFLHRLEVLWVHWPYKNIEYSVLEKAVQRVEQIVQSFGAVYAGECSERETWIWSDDSRTELNRKKVFKFQGEYVQVDKMFFPDAPFLVLEFSDRIEGPYEDADPFPYDLAAKDMEREIENLLYDRKF